MCAKTNDNTNIGEDEYELLGFFMEDESGKRTGIYSLARYLECIYEDFTHESYGSIAKDKAKSLKDSLSDDKIQKLKENHKSVSYYDIFTRQIQSNYKMDFRDPGKNSNIYNSLDNWKKDKLNLYILRMAYAYTFVYYMAYYDLLEKLINVQDNNSKDSIELNILSVGCGYKVDALGALYAKRNIMLKNEGINENKIKIRYTGVDREEWNKSGNMICISENTDDDRFICDDIVKYLNEQNKIKYNVIMFPNSMSELINGDNKDAPFYETIRKIDEKTDESINEIYMIISLRKDNYDTDHKTVDKLVHDFSDLKNFIFVQKYISDKNIKEPENIKIQKMPYETQFKDLYKQLDFYKNKEVRLPDKIAEALKFLDAFAVKIFGNGAYCKATEHANYCKYVILKLRRK
ncbi:MAG: hypothetical protein K6E47_09910 [Lachnospiraceae bacterium]|nr:hypothetical protein [Lachnospiraceae bacterium]